MCVLVMCLSMGMYLPMYQIHRVIKKEKKRTKIFVSVETCLYYISILQSQSNKNLFKSTCLRTFFFSIQKYVSKYVYKYIQKHKNENENACRIVMCGWICRHGCTSGNS